MVLIKFIAGEPGSVLSLAVYKPAAVLSVVLAMVLTYLYVPVMAFQI